jgi:hypothetical protein
MMVWTTRENNVNNKASNIREYNMKQQRTTDNNTDDQKKCRRKCSERRVRISICLFS